MHVFLIPIGRDRYEPYFEPVDEGEPPDESGSGWLARQRRRFAEVLREAEAERHRRHDPAARETEGWLARLKRRVLRWIVERAAEQRLLWHLRRADAATLHAPDDLSDDAALGLLRLGLTKDHDRHRRQFAVHLVLLAIAGLFFFIPGPNLIGYFFTFTTIGHLLAWRGAVNGLGRVSWRVSPTAALTDLRRAVVSAAPDRAAYVHAAAERLGLRHLTTFVERLAIPPA